MKLAKTPEVAAAFAVKKVDRRIGHQLSKGTGAILESFHLYPFKKDHRGASKKVKHFDASQCFQVF